MRPGQIVKFVLRGRGPAASRRTAQRQLAGGSAQFPTDAALAHHVDRARSLEGNTSLAPGCRDSGDPEFAPTKNRKACRASLDRRTPHGLCRQHPMCNRRTPLDSLARDRLDVAPWQCPRGESPKQRVRTRMALPLGRCAAVGADRVPARVGGRVWRRADADADLGEWETGLVGETSCSYLSPR
jgi:hypothetical protein